EMEWLGISVDTNYLATISQKLEKQLAKVEKAIYKEAGCEFNLNSPKQVCDVFLEKMGIPHKGQTKTGYSTNAKVLEQLAGEWPVVKKLLEYRQLFKLKSTYVDVLPELVDVTDNRLHSSFNQTITATGRLSSSDPNMQNIPIRTELGRSIRHAFVPAYRDHWCMLSADYSQIELRLLAHFSQDPILLEAFNKGQDIHSATAARVFGVPLEAVTKEQRYRAKAVNFGIIYGQTAYGLSQALDIFPGEAAEFIERYFSTYPRVKSYIDEVVAEAHKTGVATTLFGRVRDLSADLNDKTRFIREFAERAAFNTPLQGSAADIMKVAMIRCHQALKRERLESKLILQVHDEMVLEVFNPEKERVIELVRTAMGLDQPLRVPLVVDVSIGPTWMDVEDIVDDTGGATKASGGAMTLGLTLEAGVGVS
ncbi:MAG: DNA polymerase I, partial [Cyanobacteria bacterium HKST-UBA05]|nr:DNA polymerase I [Cyanobacteria bacterium HKST-UBA05]